MDLVKLNKAKTEVINLIKEKTLGNQRAEVIGAFDTSGSMKSLFSEGKVQSVFEKVFPICMAFDDDGAMPAYEFSNTVKRVPEDVTLNNLDGFVRIQMKPEYGGTDYSPAINKIVADWLESRKQPGVLSKLFGAKSTPKPLLPVYVIFLTDGECNYGDRAAATKAIVNASQHPIFFQFIGLKTHYSTDFEFLKTLDTMSGRKIDNANFFEISLTQFETLSDKDLYGKLLGEFPDFVKLALDLDMID